MSTGHYTLGELAARLRTIDPDQRLATGFEGPMCYRGYYDNVAFSPRNDVTVGYVLSEVDSAVGATFEGYKGGLYTMTVDTLCWIATDEADADGEPIGHTLLTALLANTTSVRTPRRARYSLHGLLVDRLRTNRDSALEEIAQALTITSGASLPALTVDREHGAAYLTVATVPVNRTLAVTEEVNVDLDENNGLVGVEVLFPASGNRTAPGVP